jgi:1-acyl-sn-glycerol-3-phosphate acyltransferase
MRLPPWAKVAAAAPATLLAYLWAQLSKLLPSARARARGQGAAFQWWSSALCRIFGVRVSVTGTPPRPPFLLVSNHVSYLDILALGTQLPCVFVAKAEIDGWPLFGAICRSVNTVFIDRKAKRQLHDVLERIEAKLAAGQGVVIFAEGTSGAGDVVMPFRSPLLHLPARSAHAVHWAALGYRTPPGAAPVHLAVSWWGDMPLLPHLKELLRLPSVQARIVFGEVPLAHADRKGLAEALHREITAAFQPMVDPEEIARLKRLKETDPEALPPVLRGSHDAEFAGRTRDP